MDTHDTTLRLSTSLSAIEAELQTLVKRGATMIKEINEAKTATKRIYFKRKLKGVQKEIHQMSAAHQIYTARLEAAKASAAAVAEAPNE